ncbi:flagellar biosynthesis protein FliA [Thalassorhabdomicrobium marinisediminis]|uniref:Flagellar biosynthesis protein FliA n=1 Tax=Thalassorhabdomicrobium marinisediminis TaxID=2170577 RepID=A0A2T7FU35_9RHOB|nr:flagellar biosynthesis protein FliA [Thalassorhabdomicrobium marinisediminis]PVA05662.1 flagellar biosynthesis protein FliA [Thalassorhabdomicrobium marinisediminis]
MNLMTAFRNLDSYGRRRAPEVIRHEAALLERRLVRFRPELVRLEVSVSQTRGKKRIRADLRLGLPTGVIAAREEGFGIEPVLHRAFAALGRRLDRLLSRLARAPEWKRPARRARTGRLLPPAPDRAEADRRALFFDLIEDHLDHLYNVVRRELTYLEASGAVPAGRLSVRSLVAATILSGLERFEQRPTEFSVGDWLTGLAWRTIEAEARAARRAVPDDAASLDETPDQPAGEPTAADQEMFEFYQPDDLLLLEDLVADEDGEGAETLAVRREAALALHRALADLPVLWRKVVQRLHIEDETPEQTAAVLDLSAQEVARIAEAGRAFLHQRLIEAGHAPDSAEAALADAETEVAQIPQPLEDRDRIATAMTGNRDGRPHGTSNTAEHADH